MARANYYARKKVRNDEVIVAGGDIETDGLGGDLLMVQWGIMGEIKVATGPNMVHEFFSDMLQYHRPVIWFFHFGQYDWRYFLDYITDAGLDVEIGMRSDTDIYEIRVRYPGEKEWCVMRDSYALWNSKLEALADAFCPEIPKLEIDIENFDPNNPEHIEYAKRDVEILLVGLPRLFDMLEETFGVTAGPTTAGTALRAWQKTLPDGAIYDGGKNDELEYFIRQAYYGGLVFLTDTNIHEDVVTYDINSSYPYNMDKYGVPTGRIVKTRSWGDEEMAIYRCRVKAPDNLKIPILPGRDAKGNMRWYKGEFDTCVTNRELIFAVEQGYKVLEIYEGVVFETVEYPFADIINKCKLIRSAFKGQPEEMLAKLIQNSIYGKFGTRRERCKLLATHMMKPEEFEGATPYDERGNWYITKEADDEMLCKPEWAVFITAHARLTLLKTAYSVGVENVLYGDTDSLTIKKGFDHLVDIGDQYGQWKPEKEWKYFRAIAPKVYSGVLTNGKFMGAAKGLPRKAITDKHWEELLQDGYSEATTMSLPSLRVAIKKGVSPATELKRRSSSIRNSSNFRACPDGTVQLKYSHE